MNGAFAMNPIGILFVLIGLFSLAGSLFNWEWFMNHYKARFFTKLAGRAGARIIYACLGVALIVLGSLITTGAIDTSRLPEEQQIIESELDLPGSQAQPSESRPLRPLPTIP